MNKIIYVSFPSCFRIIIILIYKAYIHRQETGQYEELSNARARLEEYTSLNVSLGDQQNRYHFVFFLFYHCS